MLEIIPSTKFKKDIKRVSKRNYDLNKLKEILYILQNKHPLEKKHSDHALIGDYIGYRDCHIENDWLLIYKIENNFLYLVRTGTHSDLFKK